MSIDLSKFIGKDHRLLENAYRFTHYLELEDRFRLGKDQDHKRIVDAFLRFVGDKDITVVKTDNDVIQEVVDVPRDVVREQLSLLENDKGLFYDDDLEISYAIVGDNFFTYVLPHMLMLSGDKETVQSMAEILNDCSLQYVGPELRPDIDIVEMPQQHVQLKITLEGTEPKIWRRFAIDDSLTFHELHQILQMVMGWENCHAYEFTVDKMHIKGEGDAGYCIDLMWQRFQSETDAISAKKTMVKDLLKKEKQKFTYTYDLGDCWRHSAVVEKILPKGDKQCPILLDGARACPPEDAGGVYGYRELLEIRKDPSHELYQERIVDWLNEDFDPEYFDVDELNDALQNLRWNIDHVMKAPRADEVKMRKLGRNEPCYCGSEKKYKKCCLPQDMKEIGKPRKVPVR